MLHHDARIERAAALRRALTHGPLNPLMINGIDKSTVKSRFWSETVCKVCYLVLFIKVSGGNLLQGPNGVLVFFN